jgi:signal transduction histidine kinase
MRRRLVAVALAATTTVSLAFCIPLARLVQDTAQERAIAAAERDAATVAGALTVTSDPADLALIIEATDAGSAGRVAVFLPDGGVVGTGDEAGDEIELARSNEDPFEVRADGDALWVRPVPIAGGVAVVRVTVPAAEITRGVAAAWLTLGALAAALVVAGAVVADRLARSVTRPAAALSDAATRVAAGDLGTRVTPAGPPELARVAAAFNHLAGRITTLVAGEREAVADISHRLRTPLTAMRLDAEGTRDPDDRERLLGDVVALELTVDEVIREARRPQRQVTSPRSDLGEVVRARTSFWSALADEQHRPWRLDADDERHLVAVPPSDLADAIDALLDNVFTHTPDGTPFRVAVTIDGEAVQLVVHDEGPGFPAGATGARGMSMAGGSGLGLDIARRAAESGGGSLRIDNDHGAVVTLELPVVA